MSIPIGTADMAKINAFVFQSIPSARKLFERYGFRNSTGIYTCDDKGGKLPPTATGSMIEQISRMEQALKEQMEVDAPEAPSTEAAEDDLF